MFYLLLKMEIETILWSKQVVIAVISYEFEKTLPI
jgi:hypothetical protein